MRVNIKALSIHALDGGDHPSVFVKLTERLKWESVAHQSAVCPAADRVLLNFATDLKLPIIDSLEFEIYVSSPITGVRPMGRARILPADIQIPSKKRLSFEAPLSGVPPVLDVGFDHAPPIAVPGRDLIGNFSISNFLCISLFADHLPKLSLIHVSRERRYANYSRPGFNFLPNVDLRSDMILFELARFSGTWVDFLCVIEFTEPTPVTFLVRTGESWDCVASATFSPIKNGLLVPFRLSFNSASEVTFTKLGKEFAGFEMADLSDRHDQILTQLDVNVRYVSQTLRFDDHTAEFNATEPVLVLLSHEVAGQLDLSFAAIRRTGVIDSTCFYNQVAVLNQAIRCDPVKIDGYDKTGIINFSQFPQSARIQYVAVLLSHGKPEAPLNDFGKVLLQVRFESGQILLELPLDLGSTSGFFVGVFENLNDSRWKFVFFGADCQSYLPPNIAKAALRLVVPVEEDVIWEG
jgi:hypothetical protein